jgi:TP901 family phage tail tape measure protein
VSLDLTATVDANVTGYERHIDNAIQATRRYEASLNSLEADMMALEKSLDDHANAALQRQHDALDKTGKALFTFGAAVGVVLGMATNEAIKWESAWAGVTKTTSGSVEEMALLEEQLRGLAMVLPATHEEIAATAEAAGQLGVAREDLGAFTKTAIDLGETTNLAAEEAATSLAQMMSVMESAPDVVDELGSTLVALGNDGASTEAQIMAMALRLTGAVKLIGGTESDVLGLASAMANLGIQSELGGGAMSRTILKIYTTAADGGDKLDTFAKFLGVTADEFSRAWSDDPVRALDLFVQGMGRAKAEGRNLVSELESMGFKGTQNMQVLLRLAGAGSELTDALDLSNKAWAENNALVIEAEKRYATTEAKISMARNQMRDAGIDIGAVLLPALAAFVDVGGDLMRTWSDLPGPLKDVLVVIGLLAAGFAIAGGAAMIAIPKIAAFKAAVAALEGGALKSAGTKLMTMGSILTGPWGLALAGGVAALGFFAAKHGDAAREVDALKATLDEQTGALTENSTEWAIKKLSDEGALDAARDLGLDLGKLTDAAMGNQEAFAGVNAELERYIKAAETEGADAGTVSLGQDALDLQKILDGTNGTLDESREKWELENLAKAGSKAASEDAADGQDKLNTVVGEGSEAVGELTEEIKTLGEQLEDLSSGFLGNRAAARAVRESTRGLREETRKYIEEHGSLDGAFKDGTKSGDEFAAMLDGLAGDYQKKIDTAERLTGSEKAVMRVYRDSRQRLIEIADQLGMTTQEAKDYAEEVLGTPEMVRTHFRLDGLPEAKADLDAVKQTLIAILELAEGRLDTPRGFGTPTVPTGRTPKPPAGKQQPTDLPTRHPRSSSWSAAGQHMGTRTPQSHAGGGSHSGDGIDYERLANSLATLRPPQPLYGDVHVTDGYGGFKRQMQQDRQRASRGGRP